MQVWSDDGLSGFGQASYGDTNNESADIAQFFQQAIAPAALGVDPTYPPYVQDYLRTYSQHPNELYKTTGAMLSRSIAGLDQALWDLAGKRAGKPVAELAGGSVPSNGRMGVYGSSLSRTFTGEQLAKKVSEAASKYGIDTFKIKVGKRMGNNTDQWPNRTQEVVEAVRAAVP